MNIEQAFRAICENPEDDQPRLAYATLIEGSDPARAQFIRWQLDYAEGRRHGVIYGGGMADKYNLLPRHGARWVHDIAKYVANGDPSNVAFDRGFPIQVRMHPEIFVEYADLIFRLAPLRFIDFVQPYNEDFQPLRDDKDDLLPYPMERLLACPQLSRLDSIGFVHCELKLGFPGQPGDIAKVARCPHLTRCLALNLRSTHITDHDYIELAEGVLTGKMIEVFPLRHAGEQRVQDIEIGMGEYIRTDFSEEWRGLERRLGYIPWLHPSHNNVHGYDRRWYLEHGKLPKYPPGSPQRPEWYAIPREYVSRSY